MLAKLLWLVPVAAKLALAANGFHDQKTQHRHTSAPHHPSTADSFTKHLKFEYEPKGQYCSSGKPPVNIPNPEAPIRIPVPATGLGYGYDSFDPNKVLACNYPWFKPPQNAPNCKASSPIKFPEDNLCCIVKLPADVAKCLPNQGKTVSPHKCVIVDNFVFDKGTSLIFNMPEGSFVGLRGTIVGYEAASVERKALFSWSNGNHSTIAGQNCLIYIPGAGRFTGSRNLDSPVIWEITNAAYLHINGIRTINANAPFWRIMANHVLMEDIGIVAANRYPSNDRNADGFQIGGDNFTLQNSFIQSGDDLIALKRSRSATFRCLTTYYGHALAIGSVAKGDTVENVVFEDIEMIGSERAARVKARKFEQGLVQNILFKNILFHEANFSGIAIQQDYHKVGDPDDKPDSWVLFKDIRFENVHGTVKNRDPEYNTTIVSIICSGGPKSRGGCQNITFKDVNIRGVDKEYPSHFVNFDPKGSGLKLGKDEMENIIHYDATGMIDLIPDTENPSPPPVAKSAKQKSGNV